MKTKPNSYSQILTIVGLGLLFFALALNHYHPRNEGIATITHGSIYKLDAGVANSVPASSGTFVYLASVKVRAPEPKPSNDPSPPPEVPTVNLSSRPEDSSSHAPQGQDATLTDSSGNHASEPGQTHSQSQS